MLAPRLLPCIALLLCACPAEEDPLDVANATDGYSENEGDCDDGNPYAYPGAASAEPELCTRDWDGDGYGESGATPPRFRPDQRDATLATRSSTMPPPPASLR